MSRTVESQEFLQALVNSKTPERKKLIKTASRIHLEAIVETLLNIQLVLPKQLAKKQLTNAKELLKYFSRSKALSEKKTLLHLLKNQKELSIVLSEILTKLIESVVSKVLTQK